MKLIDCYNYYKDKYPNYIVFIKSGNFYDVFGEDTKIISYLLNYRINEFNGIKKLGFPVNSLFKVTRVMEQQKINYLLLEKEDEEYDVSTKKRFVNGNYLNYVEKLEQFNAYSMRIEKIYRDLKSRILDENFEKLITKIENIL